MIRESFNESTGILESIWEENVSLEEIVDYIRRTKENKVYPRRLKIHTSAEKASLSLTLDSLAIISEENKKSVENYEVIFDAFVVDKALEAALTTMYKNVSAIKNYFFKVFSSKEAANNWLELM